MRNLLDLARLAVAPAVSLLLVLLLGRPMIAWLRRLGAGQRVRDDGPQRHLQKEGTPTMGGVLIVGAAVAGTLAGVSCEPRYLHTYAADKYWAAVTFSLPAMVLFFAAIGFADDWLKIHKGRSLGLRARQKLALQLVGAVAFALALVWWRRSQYGGPIYPVYSWAYMLPAGFWMLAIVATSNAVNLADGLDGLAAGLCVVSSLGFAALGLRSGSHVLAASSLSLTGACLGFLWFNRHPARVFMGDVGSLALGAAMAGMAAMLHNPWALIGFCLVPFIEAASVILQVVSFKTTGKRIFKMSPIHHHFELSGWSEQKVVWTFWAVGAAAAAVTVWISLR
jgi:phospho-N-acetylmuramoyl-pentapeptide-transferase